MDCSAKNFMLILPLIVEAVLLCARQKIALQGHQQDKIDLALPAMRNEGHIEKSPIHRRSSCILFQIEF